MDRISGIRKNIQDEIDAIWRKAYGAGKEAGYKEGESDQRIKDTALYDQYDYDAAYQKGLDEGWNLAQQVAYMEPKEREECFGTVDIKTNGCVGIIENMTYGEAKSNYDKWNQKQEEDNKICIGDEVYFCDERHTRIVTHIFTECGDYTKAVQMTESGRYIVDEIRELHKTGRHFDIQSIFEWMKEDKK